MRGGLLASIVALLLSLSGPAEAQLTGAQAVAAADAVKSNLPPDSFSGEAAFGKVAEDFYVNLNLRLTFDRENWGVGFQVPLRLRILDEAPEQPNDDYLGLLRREDWDELSDFLRVIRYVYIGQADKRGPFYVRIGELSGLTVGHGTIMHRYYNGIDADVWHTGVNAAVNIHAFGAEAVVGDVVDPYIAGLRFTVRPFKLAMGDSLLDKFVLGASVMTDSRAPLSLAGNLTEGGTTITLDGDNHPVVTRERPLAILGVDVGIELLDNSIFQVTPYVDLNKMNIVENGWGLHLGVLWGLRFPVVIDTLTVDLRTEYRRVSADYLGPYFNTTYEIDRFQYLAAGVGGGIPKLGALSLRGVDGRNGVFFDLLAGLPSFVFVGGEFIDYDGGQNDGSLRLSLEVPALEVVKFSAFYYRVGISGVDDLFELDDRSAIVAQASIPIYYVFSANFRWWRLWQATLPEGTYQAVDDWSVGIGFSIPL